MNNKTDLHNFFTKQYSQELEKKSPIDMLTMEINIYVDMDDSMNESKEYVPKDFSSIYKNESGNDYLKHTNLYHLNNMTTIDGWQKWNKRSTDFCRELGKEVLKDKKRKRRIKRFKE